MTALRPARFDLSAREGADVFLVGDFPSFKVRHPLAEVAPGRFEVVLELEPGVYRYKLVVDDVWTMDPNAMGVDRSEGYENGVVIVGGTRPPLYFAPDRRHVARTEEAIVFHAETERGTSSPALWLRAGGETTRVPMVTTGDRGDRTRWVARVALDGDAGGNYGFEGRSEMFELPAVDPAAVAPEWAKGACFYGIFVDRWHRAPSSAPDPRALERTAPPTYDAYYGGDLDGIRLDLPHIAELGADAIVLTPVHVSESPHRYDATDLSKVDPRLGGEAALSRLVEDAHRAGVKVVLDAAFTHVHEAHPFFADVLARQERSPYAPWFCIKRFPVVSRDASTYFHYYENPDLPLLDLSNPDARAHVIEVAVRLVELGADGLRLDAMDEVAADFWRELRARVRAVRSDVLLLGEVVVDDLVRFSFSRGADVTTDFVVREALVDFFARDRIDAAELEARLAHRRHRVGPETTRLRLGFLDNHDTPRFRSLAIQHDRLRLALAYLLFRPEPVWLTYGTEHGMAGGATDSKLENVWPDRLPMPPVSAVRGETFALLAAFGRLRRTHPAWRSFEVEVELAGERGLVLSRGDLRLVLNASDSPLALPPGARTVLAINEPTLEPDPGRLGGWSGRIITHEEETGAGFRR